GYDLGEAHALLAKRLPQFSYEVMEIPRIDVSSSDIRRRFAQGLSNRYLIGEEVQRYVLERELYTSYA
ncbi:MAG: nicotinic acid mononucleotide adenylyltransferase, partial [Coriobacteriia bacterium]|nr:nicotinic acid mononucleotide adenylyltransferase [Coriobacteriia bacterium]